MTRPPAVTVLMPCFNAGRFLEASLRSIVRQTFRDWEMIVVDDASTDDSAAVVDAWAAGEPRIRLLRNERNAGQTASLNRGLREARGRWIARQDADDHSHPLRLARQFELATVRPELGLIGCCGRMVDASDRLCGLLDVPRGSACIRLAAAFLNPFLHTAAFFRRDIVLGEVGGYDERFRIAQDYDLWARIVEKHPSENLAARLVCYRHLGGSLSKRGADVAFAEAGEVAGRVCERAGLDVAPCDREALAALREGRAAATPEAVAGALCRMAAGLPAGERAAWDRYAARLVLRAAGASGRPLRGVWAAVRLSPGSAASWLLERTLAP